MGQYSIKEIELLSGVKAHTLRVWEQRYDFLKPNRSTTNIRFYTDEQLKLLLNISTLNRSGMRISKIACLEREDLIKEVQKLSEIQTEPNALLDALIHSMLDFDEARFEKTLSRAILQHGFARAFSELVFPLMSRTGVLWSTGVVHPAQEHFVSNLVRRKICAAIDSQYIERSPDTRKFALFLPEGETHELMLLFTEYILRQHHHQVAYLGGSLPFEEIKFIHKSFTPDYIVVYFCLPPVEMPLQEYINQLSYNFRHQKIIVGGKQVDLQQPNLPANVTSVRCIDSLRKAIN